MSGVKRRLKTHHEKKALPHGWIVVPSKSFPDRVYFYNTITKCSTWDNPCENTNDEESGNNSSETSSTGRKKAFGTKNKLSKTSHSKRQKSKTTLSSPDVNLKVKINHEIEDYDEQQGQYFDNIPINAFSLSNSNIVSQSNNPNSRFSKTNNSDSDKQSESNVLLGDNNKPWLHFVTNPDKFSTKKFITLDDFDTSSTSQNLELEMTEKAKKNNSLFKDLSRDKGCNHLDVESFNESTSKYYNGLKSTVSKKKKKKRSRRSSKEKTVENTCIKKCNKTPAQTRLLKLRKQNAEKLKELTTKNSTFTIPKKKIVENSSNSINSNSFNVRGQTENVSFSETYPKNTKLCNSVAQEDVGHSEVDYSEEMDWEPSNEESDVRNINVFRQQLNKVDEVSHDFFFGIHLNHSSVLSSKTESWVLVLDTNIFVSCLNFVKELRDTKVPDLGYPIIYVPWRVLQELDHLKDTKFDAVDKHLLANVRKAIAYLNDNFKSKHPRVFGQSLEDFASMVDVEVSGPDDEILQTCIKFQKQHTNKLMLLTNDKNLESKAIVSGIEVYSKERFQKKYLNSKSVSPTIQLYNTNTGQYNCTVQRELYVSPTYNNALNTSGTRGDRTDDCLCEIKAILKEFISLVVETEMKVAFEGDWIKLAYKKPPWTLQDVLDCLLKHWRSVFFLNFSKETRFATEKLYDKLFKTVSVSTEDVTEVIRTAARLILSIKRFQKEKRPYLGLISAVIKKLSNLLETLSPNHSQVDSATGTSLISSISKVDDSLFYTQQAVQNTVSSSDVSIVKTLFKDIWDSLSSFCCSISDVINSSAARNDTTVQEIRLKLPQTLNQVEEFVAAVEKILEINPIDICDRHYLIVHFSNFLIRMYPTMAPDIKKDLPKSLAEFFTHLEGRFLLTNSLKDFKDFIQDLSKATEYFNTPSFNVNFSC